MSQVAIVTGAGSGVGRACALRFAREGWKVALIGRRRDPLEETAALASGECAVFPCDVSDYPRVESTVAAVRARFSRIDALINSAGINIPKRGWELIDPADFQRVLSINLHGPFHCIRACLEDLLCSRGTVVNINSEAGRRAPAKAGCSYVAAKYALAGITESLNAELRLRGLRAVSLFPGEINTSLLDQRPVPPPQEARLKMVQADDVASCAWLAVNLPANALVEELVVRPTEADYQ